MDTSPSHTRLIHAWDKYKPKSDQSRPRSICITLRAFSQLLGSAVRVGPDTDTVQRYTKTQDFSTPDMQCCSMLPQRECGNDVAVLVQVRLLVCIAC